MSMREPISSKNSHLEKHRVHQYRHSKRSSEIAKLRLRLDQHDKIFKGIIIATEICLNMFNVHVSSIKLSRPRFESYPARHHKPRNALPSSFLERSRHWLEQQSVDRRLAPSGGCCTFQASRYGDATSDKARSVEGRSGCEGAQDEKRWLLVGRQPYHAPRPQSWVDPGLLLTKLKEKYL
jgi:hypothetical protein